MKRTGSDETLRCSFCHKAQDVVGKLISSPSGIRVPIFVTNALRSATRFSKTIARAQWRWLTKLPKPLELKEYLSSM